MSKRVLIFHPALAPYRLDLFNSLAQLFELKLVFSNRDVSYQAYDQVRLLEQLTAEYSFLDQGFKILGRDVRFGIFKAIRDFAPDVIVSPEFSFVSIRIALGRFPNRPRHIVWTADNPEIVLRENPLRSAARRLVLPRIDGLIVYSTRVREFYEHRYKRLPMVAICPNSQSEDSFREKLHNSLGKSAQLLQQHNLHGQKVLLFVGRLAAVKRIDRLLKAFAAVRKENENVKLVLVGGGPEHSALSSLSRQLGIEQSTIFTGHCDGAELHAWFNLGAVLALPSDFEPWGAVVNEALIAGIPVICSQEVGAGELITAGTNGTVLNADDESEFSASLTKWLGKAPALDPTHPLDVRKILMTEPFSKAVAGFSAIVESETNTD